jgi:hypothetical protein
MPLTVEQRDSVRNIVERWLALNADADHASLTIQIDGGAGVAIKTREKLRVALPATTVVDGTQAP